MNIHRIIKQLGEATRRIRQQFPYLPQAFRLVRQAAGGLLIVWLVLLLVQGLLPVAAVYLTRELVDGIAAMVGAGGGWQAMQLDLSFYDDPGYYNQLHRARIDALSRPAALIENAGALLQSFITLAAMGGVLLSFGIWIPLLLAFSTLPALLVVFRHAIRFHNWQMQNTMAIQVFFSINSLINDRISGIFSR